MHCTPAMMSRRALIQSAAAAMAGAAVGATLAERTPALALEKAQSPKGTKRFVFTCDDVGGSPGRKPVEWFQAVVGWLDHKHIPATFFWIPKPHHRRADKDKLWMNAISRARQSGHDFQLHGLTHHCLEFGVPQPSIRRHAPQMFEQYEREIDKWKKEHAVESLRAKFNEATTIYENAFGERPLIFRAPCLGICSNAYRAMFDFGIRYSSSRSVNPAATGYVITRKPELQPWQPDYSGKPFKEPPGVLEIPTLEDIAIKGVEQDVPIDALGFQAHMVLKHREWSVKRTWEILEEFSKFGEPLHFTEVTIISGWHSNEQRQARLAAQFYTILFSHPAVEAITWWDFTEQKYPGCIRAPGAGLLRDDMTPKPAYYALKQLIKDKWWTRTKATVEDRGRARFRGFFGAYQVSATAAGTKLTGRFQLGPSATTPIHVRLVEERDNR